MLVDGTGSIGYVVLVTVMGVVNYGDSREYSSSGFGRRPRYYGIACSKGGVGDRGNVGSSGGVKVVEARVREVQEKGASKTELLREEDVDE